LNFLPGRGDYQGAMGVAMVPGNQSQRQRPYRGWLLAGTIALVSFAAGWPHAARAQDDPAAATPSVDASASAAPSATPLEVPCVAEHERSQLLRQEGKLLEARTLLLECARVECAPAIRGDCVRWQQELQLSIPSLVFAATLDGQDHSEVVVSMEGRVLARHLDGRALEFDPGEYDFEFESATGQTLSRRITVREGEKARLVTVAFVSPGGEATPESGAPPPPTPAPAPVERPVPVIAYALGGLAAAATVSWIYFGTSALEKERDANEQCAPFCSTSKTDDIRMRVWAADVSAAVAVTAAAAALYTYWTRPEVSAPQPTMAWRVGVGITSVHGTGLMLGAGRRF
jgi:hypothetical protein